MKRILSRKSLMCLCCVSVFFTGCNKGSVSTNFEIPTYEIAAPPESRGRERETREQLGAKDSEKRLQEESERLISERFDKVTGEPAFWMPKEHSAEKEDLTFFQVLDLVDGYFYYFYVTRNTETGEEVHAVVKNNYKNKDDHKILHQTARTGKTDMEDDGTGRERPPFYAQMYKKDGSEQYMISIYDDGDLYVFDSDGEVFFERTSKNGGENMLGLMERIFRVAGDSPDYYEINVTNVTTDGRYAFYIPVSLSKEDYREIKDGEDIKVENYMLFYSYTPIEAKAEFLRQDNIKLRQQTKYWADLAEGATQERDPQKDWEDTLKAIPYEWGDYKMYGKNLFNSTIEMGEFWKWKTADVRKFIKDESGAPSSKHDESYAEMVKELTDKKSLDNYFFIDPTDGYCSLVGSIETVKTDQKKITRTYSVTTGEGENATTATYPEEVMVDMTRTASFSSGTAIDRFEVVRNLIGFNMAPGNIEDSDEYIIGMYKDNAYVLMSPNKTESTTSGGTFPRILDDRTESGLAALDIQLLNQVDGKNWLMASDISNGRIFLNHSSSNDGPVVLMTSDLNPEGYQSSEKDQALTQKMQDLAVKDGRSKYDFSEVNIYSGADSYGRENVIALGGGEFLFTTFYNGMQVYKTEGGGSTDIGQSTSGTITRISDWPLYQAWREDNGNITAVGFDRTDVTFFSMDIAKARVYTFDLQQDQADANQYKIPFEDGKGPAGIGRKPLESQEVPDDMKGSWEEAKKIRETAPPVSGAETVPDETIYETGEDIGKMWESRAAESKSTEEEGENGGE